MDIGGGGGAIGIGQIEVELTAVLVVDGVFEGECANLERIEAAEFILVITQGSQQPVEAKTGKDDVVAGAAIKDIRAACFAATVTRQKVVAGAAQQDIAIEGAGQQGIRGRLRGIERGGHGKGLKDAVGVQIEAYFFQRLAVQMVFDNQIIDGAGAGIGEPNHQIAVDGIRQGAANSQRRIEDQGVKTAAGQDIVEAGGRIKHVVAGVAQQNVVAGVAGEGVGIVGADDDGVGPGGRGRPGFDQISVRRSVLVVIVGDAGDAGDAVGDGDGAGGGVAGALDADHDLAGCLIQDRADRLQVSPEYQLIGATATGYGVVADRGDEGVVAGAAVQNVVAEPAVQHIIAAAGEDGVVAGAAVDGGGGVVEHGQLVGAGAATDGFRAPDGQHVAQIVQGQAVVADVAVEGIAHFGHAHQGDHIIVGGDGLMVVGQAVDIVVDVGTQGHRFRRVLDIDGVAGDVDRDRGLRGAAVTVGHRVGEGVVHFLAGD